MNRKRNFETLLRTRQVKKVRANTILTSSISADKKWTKRNSVSQPICVKKNPNKLFSPATFKGKLMKYGKATTLTKIQKEMKQKM